MLRSVATLWPYFVQQRRRMLALVVLSGLFSAVTVLQPWPMKLLVDYALGDAGSIASLSPAGMVWAAALATLGLFLVNALLDVVVSWTWMATGQRMVYDLAADVFARLLSVPFPLQRRSVGDCLERLSSDAWCVYTVASDLLVGPMLHLLTLAGVVVVAWQLDPQLTMISLVTAPVIAASVVWYGPKLKRRARQGREISSNLASFVHQTVTSIPLVQAYGAEDRNQERFESLVDDVVSVAQRGVLVNKSFSLLNGAAAAGGRAVVLFAGGLQVFEGTLSVGSLLVFMAYVRTLQGACENLLKIYSKLKASEANVERLAEILEQSPQLPEPGERPLSPPPRPSSAIRFRDVAYAYRAGTPAIRDLSVDVAPGEQVAVVGASGAGKSTLVSLLLRLVDVDQGTVEIDGVDVRRMGLDDLRSRIAVVLQEPYLLPATIAENIAVGRPDASPEQIRAAAELAGAAEFIERLPAGYDTKLGERGATLSGGQRHRIAIARAFIRDASIVVLDEPTAALDAATEAELMASFKRLAEGRTTIVVSHRMSTIRDADRILVLDDGQLVESGSPAELFARRGHFHRLQQAAYLGAADGQVSA
jgi:ATP-binding cassette subfamily B protein/subfamily B ATP-binding cassette protein MsbA